LLLVYSLNIGNGGEVNYGEAAVDWRLDFGRILGDFGFQLLGRNCGMDSFKLGVLLVKGFSEFGLFSKSLVKEGLSYLA
jgi:hypothetical protein